MRRLWVVVVVSLMCAGVLTQSVSAQTNWYVSPGGNDANDCRSSVSACRTIAAAIAKVGTEAGDIVFVAAGVYTENLSFGKDLTIIGDGMDTVIEGGSSGRAMEITAGIVDLFNLTIRNSGQEASEQPGGGISNRGTLELTNVVVTGNRARSQGGGIFNSGTLSLRNSTVSNNQTILSCGAIYNASGGTLDLSFSRVTGNQTAQDAGGICNLGTATVTSSTIDDNRAVAGSSAGIANVGNGTLTLVRSTISNNDAGSLGGGLNNAGTATVTNSTISGNQARNSGSGGGIFNSGTLTLTNATITNNTVNSGTGGGIRVEAGNVTIRNTIIAGNRQGGTGTTQGSDCSGSLTAAGPNLVQSLGACFVGGELQRVLSADPQLGPLQSNGGSTLTHMLPRGSLAIDAGTNEACPSEDQRGASRPLDGNGDTQQVCDLGAIESETVLPPTPTPTLTPLPTATVMPTPTTTTTVPTDGIYLPLVAR